ncbi:MAG: hypothetical protein II581_08435 [Oscillospiraceae bacterium]|nr:hypothetical protein [Oscillospiraceae bacterium]
MIGSQEPRIQIEPQRASTDGEDAAILMEAYGNRLDAWQKLVLDCWLGRDEDGNYNVTSAGLAVPRQNGKNVCIEGLEFFGLMINGERILHTAHQVRTSKKSFRRLVNMFTDKHHPEIMSTVKTIRYTNGEEAIELTNGGTIEFLARSRQAARGFDGISRIVFDEAQELTDDQVEAIMATLSASDTGTRQLIYAGTPPYPNCPGEVFRRRRKSCLDDPGPHDAWHEWSVAAKDIGQIKVGDRSVWYMTNPALGIRLSEEFTAEELGTMSADGFARERLGWWSPVLTDEPDRAISASAWNACKSKRPKPEGKTAYGVKFTPDGATVALCGAVIPEDGDARISLIEKKQTGQGIQWLADWLNQRSGKASCVVIDGRNGVDVLVEKITGKDGTWKAKNSVIRPGVRDVIASVSVLTDALAGETVTWYELQEELNDSAMTAIKRPIGGGWGFGGENSAPIEAAALALWGAKTSKRDPNRKMRIG